MKTFKQLISEQTNKLTLTYTITGTKKSTLIGTAKNLDEIDDMLIDFLSKMDKREKTVNEFFAVTVYVKSGSKIIDKTEYKYNTHLDINAYDEEDVLDKAMQKFRSLADPANKKYAQKILKRAFSKNDFLKAKQVIDKETSSEYDYAITALQITMDSILLRNHR